MPSAIQDGLADRIYEAAFLPEMWPDVLEHVADVAGAASGELLTFSRAGAPIFKASRVSRDGLIQAALSAGG